MEGGADKTTETAETAAVTANGAAEIEAEAVKTETGAVAADTTTEIGAVVVAPDGPDALATVDPADQAQALAAPYPNPRL